jgi:hypothetical protein
MKYRPAPEIELEDANGTVYPLSFPDRLLQSIDGMGLPPIQHWTTRSPYQDGRSHWGYAVQPRVLNLVLYLKGCNRSDMYAKRRANVDMLSPRNGAMTLRLITPPPDPRQYELRDVWVSAGYTLSSQDQPSPIRQVGGVQLTAYDPIWKWTNAPLNAGESRDAEGRSCVVDDTWTTSAELTLPFTGPYLLGTTTGTNTLTCTNNGSWATKPYITLEGPCNDWVLSNATNGDRLSWDGYQIATGETITIDIPGKTVTSDVSGDVSTYLSGDTGSFELDPGANSLTVYASGGIVNLTTTISVCWYVELLGV